VIEVGKNIITAEANERVKPNAAILYIYTAIHVEVGCPIGTDFKHDIIVLAGNI